MLAAGKMARSFSFPRIVRAVLVTSVATFAFLNAAVYVLRFGGVEGQSLALAAELIGGPAAAIVFFCLVVSQASRAAFGAGELLYAHALLVGLSAALSLQVIFAFLAPPVYLAETALYLCLGLVGGFVAALAARRHLASKESVYRGTREIRSNPDPDAITAVVGRSVRAWRAGAVILWRADLEAGRSGRFLPYGTWTPPHVPTLPADLVLDREECPKLRIAEEEGWALLLVRRLPARQREAWSARSVRTLLVIPLMAERFVPAPARTAPEGEKVGTIPAGRELIGFLTIALRRRTRIAAASRTDYLTLAQEAAGATENARLLKQEKKDARRLGEYETRQRLSRDMHDTAKATLTGVEWLTRACLKEVPANGNSAALREKLQIVHREVEEVLETHERIIGRMKARPPNTDGAAIHDLIEARTDRWSKTSGVRVSFATAGSQLPTSAEAQEDLQAVLQEALANAGKHARANAVRVTLSYESSPEDPASPSIRLVVADDGVGFAPPADADSYTEKHPHAPARGGVGLASMRERASRLGGTLDVMSAPEQGTAVVFEVPSSSPNTPQRNRQ